MFDNQTDIDSANMACTIMVPDGKSDAWLTPSLECDWGGVACNDDEFVNRIDFGKKRPEKMIEILFWEYCVLLTLAHLLYIISFEQSSTECQVAYQQR